MASTGLRRVARPGEQPEAAPLVGSCGDRHCHHRARVRVRSVRGRCRARRRLDAARPRRNRRDHRRQGRFVRDQPGDRVGHHPTGLARQPAPHRDRRPARAPARHPGRDDPGVGADRGRSRQPGLLVVRRHLRVRTAAVERHQRLGRSHGRRGDEFTRQGGSRRSDRSRIRRRGRALRHHPQPRLGCARIPWDLRARHPPARPRRGCAWVDRGAEPVHGGRSCGRSPHARAGRDRPPVPDSGCSCWR